MNNDEILEKIFSLAKESAIADAKISSDVDGIKSDMTAFNKRMDKQEDILDRLVKQQSEQKSLIENLESLKKTVDTNDTRIGAIEKINAGSRLDALEHYKERSAQRIEVLERRPKIKLADAVVKVAWGAVIAGVGGLMAIVINNIFK